MGVQGLCGQRVKNGLKPSFFGTSRIILWYRNMDRRITVPEKTRKTLILCGFPDFFVRK
nr:MAG TPA: hypothetical protein [Caudoviricetes sp.]